MKILNNRINTIEYHKNKYYSPSQSDEYQKCPKQFKRVSFSCILISFSPCVFVLLSIKITSIGTFSFPFIFHSYTLHKPIEPFNKQNSFFSPH